MFSPVSTLIPRGRLPLRTKRLPLLGLFPPFQPTLTRIELNQNMPLTTSLPHAGTRRNRQDETDKTTMPSRIEILTKCTAPHLTFSSPPSSTTRGEAAHKKSARPTHDNATTAHAHHHPPFPPLSFPFLRPRPRHVPCIVPASEPSVSRAAWPQLSNTHY